MQHPYLDRFVKKFEWQPVIDIKTPEVNAKE
jgi:hypothetical protein